MTPVITIIVSNSSSTTCGGGSSSNSGSSIYGILWSSNPLKIKFTHTHQYALGLLAQKHKTQSTVDSDGNVIVMLYFTGI